MTLTTIIVSTACTPANIITINDNDCHNKCTALAALRFQQALHGDLDEHTCEQLDNVLTIHFRGRYAAVDVSSMSPEHADQAIGTNNFKATAHLHHHMAHLFHQYVKC